MALCPECNKHFRVPEDEPQDHECPRCEYHPGKENEDKEG